MTVRNFFDNAADNAVRAYDIVSLPFAEVHDFITARSYMDELYDARFGVVRPAETLIRGAFSLAATVAARLANDNEGQDDRAA